jgi:diguanylate cyclase (GGDEF)-like protein
MERARAAGATDFIGKPFDSVHLLARTQAHADSHQATNTLRQENTALEDMSGIDPLTGLVNESTFMERGYQLLSYAIRHNSDLCIYRIEIDNFGELYREHGEEFTGSITQSIGEILTSAIRTEDTAARIGAARFALLLPGMEKYGIRNLAERINREIGRRTFKAGDTRLRVTLSIGVASPDIQRNTRFDELLALADQRLGQAVAMGGDQVILEEDHTTLAMNTGGSPERLDLFREVNLEVEEIELAAPVYAHKPEDIFGSDASPDQVSQQPQPAAEPVSATFAGPVPEDPPMGLSVTMDGDADTGISGSPVEQDAPCPTVPANDVGTEPVAEPLLTSPVGDRIIAAAFSAHPVGDAANEVPDSKPAVELPDLPDDDLELLELRPGILKRIMSGLFGWLWPRR